MNHCKRFMLLGLLAMWTVMLIPVQAMAESAASFRLAMESGGGLGLKANELRITLTGDALRDVYAFEARLAYD
ncbi:hypothetical protein ABS198_21705, partial [Acinetobacter baumannii]|uniref:hypothetical protein n=1 Tax=Acinetobacter baumannii TaxID=470 RepID=UPI0033304480